MCRNLNVSKAGYYAWRGRSLSARAKRDVYLSAKVASAHAGSGGTYGSPRILEELRDAGITTSRKRIARLMRTAGICAKKRRRYKITTHSKHSYPIAENVLRRDFRASKPNTKWAADVTYFSTSEGWLYLAIVIDLFSRRVVGWSMGERNDVTLVLTALKNALASRQASGVLVHTDRGSQYACRAYTDFLSRHRLHASMSRKGDCWDNAVVESFFSTIKTEMNAPKHFKTRAEARSAIFEYIESWYNRRRRHSTNGYISPERFEECRRA